MIDRVNIYPSHNIRKIRCVFLTYWELGLQSNWLLSVYFLWWHRILWMTGHLVYVRSVYIIIHNCVHCIYSLKAIVRNLEVGIHLFYIFIVSEEGTLCLESSNAIQILVLSEKKISTNHCIFFFCPQDRIWAANFVKFDVSEESEILSRSSY